MSKENIEHLYEGNHLTVHDPVDDSQLTIFPSAFENYVILVKEAPYEAPSVLVAKTQDVIKTVETHFKNPTHIQAIKQFLNIAEKVRKETRSGKPNRKQ